MATLTEVSSIARKTIKYGSVALVVIALMPSFFGFLKSIYLKLNPPPPPPPTVRYGKLPWLEFPKTTDTTAWEYKLETIGGGFPLLPNVAKVYLVGINKSRLFTLDNMKAMVKGIGLETEPVQLDERTFRFFALKFPIEMIFDVITGDFRYSYNWQADADLVSRFSVPIGNQAVGDTKRFLERLGSLPPDLTDGNSKIVYLVASGSAMNQVASPYDASFARVDLFRSRKDDLDVVTAGGTTSPVNAILSSIGSPKQFILANFHYSRIMDNDFATYPLKPVQTAWDELVAGGGHVAIKPAERAVIIRNVKLAYYEADSNQYFLQPVYVFEGDKGFVAYVQAVDSSYMQPTPTPDTPQTEPTASPTTN